MVHNKHWVFVVLLTLTFYGCYSNVSGNISTEILHSEIIQEQNLTDKDIQEQKVEFEEPKSQEANKLKLTNDSDYEIYFERFAVTDKDTHTDILIEYPQIKNMESLELEKKINAMLKEKAISVYKDEDFKGFNLQMETQIECFNLNTISVKYSGYWHLHGIMSSNDVMYSTNIDLKTGKLINIQDFFNDGFQEKLNRNVFMYSGVGKASEGESIEPNTHEYGYINADESVISEMFNNYYSNMTNEQYYFSKEYFGIIVKAPSGPTAYLGLSASYDNLKDCMNYDDGFWDEILKS